MTNPAVSSVTGLPPWFPVPSTGGPAASYRLFSYIAGTTTKQVTYTDYTGGTQQTNPIVMNASGYPQGTGGATDGIWALTGLAYKYVFAAPGSDDPPTSPLWTIDGLTAGGSGSSQGGLIISGAGVPVIVASQGVLYEQTNGGPQQSLWQSLGTATGNLEATQLADGASHLYPLAETSGTAAVDAVSVSPSNGTYSGTYTLAQPPLSADQSGSALFSGGHVALTYKDLPAVASFSVEVLCEPTAEGAGTLVANDAPLDTGAGWHLKANGLNGFQLNMGCSNGSFSINTGTYAPFNNGVFHVVFTFDSVNQIASLYVNGALANQYGNTGTYVAGGYNIHFGNDPQNASGVFTGQLQLVGLYPSVLSSTQIVNHYKAIKSNGTALWFLVGSGGAGGSSSPATAGASPIQAANFTLSTTYSTWRVNTAGGITVTAATAPNDGDTYTIKDVTGNAGTNNIVFLGTIDGATNPVLVGRNYGWQTIQWNAVQNQYNYV